MSYNEAIPMDMHAAFHGEQDDRQQLLQDELDDFMPRKLPPPKNSKAALMTMGLGGSVILVLFFLLIIHLLFGRSSEAAGTFKPPAFGDIGCAFPNELVSPTLTENLTLHNDVLEVRASGRGIGDIIFTTESEKDLAYVNMDVFLQGEYKSDLQQVYTRAKAGLFELQTPETATQGCIRYTLHIQLPRTPTKLIVETEALTHVSFADIALDSRLETVSIHMAGDADRNLVILPEAHINHLSVEVGHGYVTGTALLYDTLDFRLNQAQADMEVVAMQAENKDSEQRTLTLRTATEGSIKVLISNPNDMTLASAFHGLRTGSFVLGLPDSFAGPIRIEAETLSTSHAGMIVGTDGVAVDRGQDGQSSLLVDAPLADVSLEFAV